MSVFHRMFGSGNQSNNESSLLVPPLHEMTPMVPPPPPRGHLSTPQHAHMRQYHELPRLQVPPLSLVQPQQPQQPQLHWKIQGPAAPVPPQQQQQPVSRMRMMANFFTTGNTAPPQPPSPPPPTSNVLPSFGEILARTKQLYINPAPVSDETPMENIHMDNAIPEGQPVEMMETMEQPTFQPTYAAARYSLQPPLSIQVNTIMDDVDTAMDMPSSPSGSMSPTSQSGKSSKRRERWTEDEHARFMEGLNRYGRKWKKIQAFVKTKTAVQVRTHAYGYFAKLLRNMPEDDAAWELAEEMSSLPGAVLKGPSSGKRRSEPKTDEAGMEVLRRFVFSKKKTDMQPKTENAASTEPSQLSAPAFNQGQNQPPMQYPAQVWGSTENWNAMESQASSVMLDLKRQRIN
ncbi:hypothetical protein Poli38472_001017 [Pythium oligandrum]|uniref:Uncharacterized protein n=1 Tax=Pythium oligandrum TaxID=41045 RepID=A0A8K1CUG4_PYTOL|nr:hypothetical protein Poli38472_001017 [Pythium oligandrum]|eukprot:TMW68861.1 hypothetical protein Poli38472_001017 [Pythium oligandrum]